MSGVALGSRAARVGSWERLVSCSQRYTIENTDLTDHIPAALGEGKFLGVFVRLLVLALLNFDAWAALKGLCLSHSERNAW